MFSRWQPVIDGTFITDFPSKLTAASKFTKVPIMLGMMTGPYMISLLTL